MTLATNRYATPRQWTLLMNHARLRTLFLAALRVSTLAVLSLILITPASAQAPAAPQTPPSSAEVSDDMLEKLVVAFEAVEVIRLDLQAKLEETQDPAEANQLQQQANTDMVAAVQNSGMDPNQFNLLVAGLSEDPALLARFQEARAANAN